MIHLLMTLFGCCCCFEEDHAAVRSWHDKLVLRFGAGGGGGGCFGNDLIEVARL